MLERELRNVLLIKGLEDSDPGGELLPLADRATASREVLRQDTGAGSAPTVLDRDAQRRLVQRSDRLLQPLLVRHPFLATLLQLLEGPAWISGVTLAVCLALGAGLSALGGSNQIDILGFPLLLLVLWNLGVYAVLGLQALRRPTRGTAGRPLSGLYGRWIGAGAQRLLAQSSRFNAPLTAALQRFVGEWLAVTRPRVVARGLRLFHLGSAALASGLVAGLYFRGIWRGYRAGWDSTWPDLVPPLLHAFYGAAAWLTRISLPEASELASMRWSAGNGEPAAPWIHLMAVTAVLFIIGPRLLLAGLGSLRIWRLTHAPLTPAYLLPYYRAVLGPAGLPPGRGIVSVVPYGYEPPRAAQEGLHRLLGAVFGGTVAVDVRALVPFGQEDAFVAALPQPPAVIADCLVLLLNLASTPEDENHGTILAGLRDWLATSQAGAQLLIVVDESAYAARMQAAPERIPERRALWRKFLRDRGLAGALLDLAAADAADGTLALRDALQIPGSAPA